MHRRSRLLLLAGLPLACTATKLAPAQVVVAPSVPVVGSSNPASPEPPIARPTSTPCSVTLFSNLTFNDYGTRPISYTPACAGPWSKVILTADITVSAGRQFDRTAKFYLGGANIYFGTTAEPRAALSPSWHVERDLTDLSSLFTSAQTGVASIQNVVDSTYTGVIYGSATLLFYPADANNPAPVVPSSVVGFPSNDTASLNTTTDKSSVTTTFPKSLERVYLDVVSQSQSNDEFWYLNVPDSVSAALQSFGSTAFRETEVSIDGTPAGVAPVYPWIYTGGIDPYLWEPIPGVQTLNLKPYRVDLSPFAGVLADGKQHTVAVSVFNASNRFDVASTLLLYTGPTDSVSTGSVTLNTLSAAPTPQVETYLNTAADGTVSGPVNVSSARQWIISGTLTNSADGRIDTTISATNSFQNDQSDLVSGDGSRYYQAVQQETKQQELTTITTNTGTTASQHTIDYPLFVNYRQAPNDNNDGGFYITTTVQQRLSEILRAPLGPNSPNPVVTAESVQTADTLHYSAAGAFLGHDNNTAQASFGSKDAQQRCVSRTLAANQLILTSENDSTSCSMVP